METKMTGSSGMSEVSFTEGAKVPTLSEASDALAEVARHMLNTPAGAKHRPLTNDLKWAVDDYMRARHPEQGQSNDAPANAIEEKLDRMGYILIRLVGGLGFQAMLTVFGGDYHAIGAERDVRINVLRDKLGNEHVAALYGFADEHGLELEFSSEHGVTLRLEPNWAERPIHAG